MEETSSAEQRARADMPAAFPLTCVAWRLFRSIRPPPISISVGLGRAARHALGRRRLGRGRHDLLRRRQLRQLGRLGRLGQIRHDARLAVRLAVALDTREGRHARVRDKVPQRARPRLGLRQRVVELGRDLAHLRQTEARDARKVVVLVVVADVPGQVVERTIVRVGLLALDKLIVLRDKVARDRVQAESEPVRDEQVADAGESCNIGKCKQWKERT